MSHSEIKFTEEEAPPVLNYGEIYSSDDPMFIFNENESTTESSWTSKQVS